MSRDEQHVKLGDLSIVRDVNGLLKFNKLVGTLNYLSPELIKEENNFGFKIDIWSFGCTLFELITLRRAFNGKSSSDVIKEILFKEISLPSTVPRFRFILEK